MVTERVERHLHGDGRGGNPWGHDLLGISPPRDCDATPRPVATERPGRSLHRVYGATVTCTPRPLQVSGTPTGRNGFGVVTIIVNVLECGASETK